MHDWLASNRDTYEFYLLHAMLHDTVRRSALLTLPLEPDDFGKDEHMVMMSAIKMSANICSTINHPFPSPPTFEWLSSYVTAAANKEGMDRDTQESALDVLRMLIDPIHSAQWVHINPYLHAWLTTRRGKRYAMRIQMANVADVEGMVTMVQRDIAAIAMVTAGSEEDEMAQVISGTNGESYFRRPTGVAGLDSSLNGGWGDGECYLMFGGTGAGKSILAAQCVWHEAEMGGYPLVVSTELKPREYVTRIVSNAAGVYINHVQDCENFNQIRLKVSTTQGAANRLELVDRTLQTIAKRIRIAKVSADDGLDARALLQREYDKYEQLYGHKPTLVFLDWLGSSADSSASASRGTSERALAWEMSANGCVKFADVNNVPTAVLAQAVNDSQLKNVLTINDIGISKGIGKNMVLVLGITNAIDKKGVQQAAMGKADMPASLFLEDQLFCIVKARKGEGGNVKVKRKFQFQRFEAADRK
jgi:hypothetical protein